MAQVSTAKPLPHIRRMITRALPNMEVEGPYTTFPSWNSYDVNHDLHHKTKEEILDDHLFFEMSRSCVLWRMWRAQTGTRRTLFV